MVDAIGGALRRATGPALLSAPTILAFTVLSLGIALFSAPTGTIGLGARPLWFAVGAIAQIPVVLILLLGARVIGDRLGRGARSARVAVVIAAGLARGAGLHAGSSLLDLPGAVPLGSRLLTATFATLLWMLLIGLVVGTMRSFRQDYGEVFEREVAIASIVDADAEIPRRIGREIADWGLPVAQRLDGLRGGAEAAAVAEAADAIRALVRTRLRPLSHRLWFSDSERPPLPRPGPVLAEAWRGRVLLGATALGILTVSLMAGTLPRYELADSVPLVGLVLVVGLACWGFVRILARALPPATVNAISLPIVAVMIGFAPGIAAQVLGAGAVTEALEEWPAMVSVSVAVVLAAAAIGMARVTLDDRTALLRLLHSDQDGLDAAIAERARRRREREIGLYLHNHVKSQLSAHALRLREAAAGHDGDVDAATIDATVEAAIRMLSRPIPDEVVVGRTSGLDRLREVAESWEGIASVVVDTAGLESAPESTRALVVDVVAEAVANAVRSGGATTVEVRTSLHVDDAATVLAVEVRDDGRLSDHGAGAAGLGSAWLDSVAPGMWRLVPGQDGTVLEVRLPVLSA